MVSAPELFPLRAVACSWGVPGGSVIADPCCFSWSRPQPAQTVASAFRHERHARTPSTAVPLRTRAGR